MKTPLFFSFKQSLGSRLFVLAIIVSIVVPQAYMLSLPLAFAEEETEDSNTSVKSVDAETNEHSSDAAVSIDSVVESAENTRTIVTSDVSNKTIEITDRPIDNNLGDIKTNIVEASISPFTPVDETPTLDIPDNTNDSGGTSNNTSTPTNNDGSTPATEDFDPQAAGANSLTTTPQMGSITVCNVIAKANGEIVTSSAGLPQAAFSLNLRTRIGNSTPIQTSPSIQEFDFYSHLFTRTTPSPIPLSAQCLKYNLEIKQYIYSPVTVTSQNSNVWETPKYNDQFITSANSVNNFYPYSYEMFDNNQANDGQRNEDSDGILTLTTNRPHRVLVILNKLKPVTPQTGSITVCKMIITKNGQIATSSAGLPAGQFDISFYPLSNPSSFVQHSVFNAATFAPTTPSVSGFAAECKKYEHLPLQAYVYSQEAITGAGTTEVWQTPKYNDGYILPPNQLSNYFEYSPESFDNDPSNDALKNEDSDGIITLNINRPDRVLVVMNKHNLVDGWPPTCANGIQLSVTEFKTAVDQGRITYGQIVVNDATTTATFTINNNTGCTAPIALTSYKMFDPLPTLSTQVLYDRHEVIQATSTTTLRVNIPNCAAQIDAWFGLAPEFLVDSNPYAYPAVPHVLRAILVRQNQSCRTNPVNTAPNITLVGSNPINITKNSTFTDPGATAIDAEDGNLTASIVTTGTVNTSVVGAYTLTYTVTDSGNLSASTTRVVNVTDGGGPTNNPPTITVLGNNPMFVYVGTTFTDPGATATDQEDGDLTSQIVTTGSVDANTLGTYTITYTVSDSKGLSVSSSRTVNVIENTDDNGGGGGGGGHRRSSGGKVLGAETGPTACFYLNDYLRRDFNNDQAEVLKLQLFLKYFEGESALTTTGVFDQATYDAVSRFQTKYRSDILSPWGYSSPTGYVYILTKKKINEIFCKTAFPVSTQQQEEIDNFKALIQSLKSRGVSVPENNSMSHDTIMIDDHMMDIKDIVGVGTSTVPENTKLGKTIKDKIDTKNLKVVAAAIFSVPKDREAILQGIYFLLIALIAIYLFTEIVVGSQDSSKLTKYQIWSRKATGYFAGLIVAIIAAVWYQAFSIVVPLLVLAICSGVFLAWTMTKKSDDDVINLPPSNR